MEERRKFVRLDTRLEAAYAVLPSGQKLKGTTKDIGGSGICLFTDSVLASGTRLQVALTLPGREQPVHFIGEVVWSEAYEVIAKNERRRAVETGLRFVEITPQDQQGVMQHVILNVQPPQR